MPPIVDAGGPYSGVIGQPVQFDASNTVDPDSGDTLIYLWDFGDGSTPPFPSQDPTASHTYTALPDVGNEYIAKLAVTDGVNTPVLVDVAVTITDAPPPPVGDVWTLVSPYSFEQLTLRLEPFAGILMVEVTQPSGASSIAIGMELQQGVIFWMDVTGAIYFGNIDRVAGSMSGVAFGGPGGGGIWFAEKL
ncbi:MAG: PKD domain-containing protein [Pirellulaceae bacterium]